MKLLGKTRRKPEDFLPPWLRVKSKAQTDEQIRLTFESWATQGGVPSRQ